MFEWPSTFCTSSVASTEVGKLIEDCIARLGVHLIDLEVRGEGQAKTVDVYIDSEAGITTDICSEVSREIDRSVDCAGFERGSYRLTVSSPGIARPLKFAWQYKKHVGRRLDLLVRSPDGTKSVSGKLLSMDETTVVIDGGKERQTVPLNSVVEARVKAPW